MNLCLALRLDAVVLSGGGAPTTSAYLRTADGGYYLTTEGGKIRITQ